MSQFHSFILLLALGGIVVFARPSPATAQGRTEPTVRTSGTTVNLFETLDPATPIDGVIVQLPPEWTLREVRLLRYGTEPVDFRQRPYDDTGTYLLAMDRALTGPHEAVVRVQLPARTGTFEWGLTPFTWEKGVRDTTRQIQIRRGVENRKRLEVTSAPSPNQENQALDLSEASAPLLLRADQLPQLGQVSSFTIEFWMQTNGLDEIILSTWNGNESVAYPAEFVVDRSGRLRFYSGQPGQHQALRSGRPVADGRWHHVATVYDAERSRLRLFVDGAVVDSLRGRVPVSPGPVPLALGARLNGAFPSESTRAPLFSGRLDELRIWRQARSVRSLTQLKSRPLRTAADELSDVLSVRLGFEESDNPVIQSWPEGARRVPTALSFDTGLRNLQADPDGRSVTLRWVAETSSEQPFLVQRSDDGTAFTTIAELSASEAKRSSSTEPPEFSYTDEGISGQVVYYRIRQQSPDGGERTTGTIKIGLGAAEEEKEAVTLIGNFPNPFSESTTIAYEVRSAESISLSVWDLKGHLVAELASGTEQPGYHEVNFSAQDLTSGTYFVRLETSGGIQSHRMVVLK